MKEGQLIRFTRHAPHEEWTKGDYGKITSVLAMRPQATSDIYLIKLEDKTVWATHDDIELSQGKQLTLY